MMHERGLVYKATSSADTHQPAKDTVGTRQPPPKEASNAHMPPTANVLRTSASYLSALSSNIELLRALGDACSNLEVREGVRVAGFHTHASALLKYYSHTRHLT